jgi:hypothetical protein
MNMRLAHPWRWAIIALVLLFVLWVILQAAGHAS